ncbi:ATP-dependent RNA helicase DDX47 [Aphelenchoides avenae]|nr:ATP-dependent RNA helicase DDX47 [Aphelenchus avenae]
MSSSEDEVPVVRQKKKVTNGSAKNVDGEPTTSSEPAQKDFNELGITEVLSDACHRLGWQKPTKIQQETIPVALTGKDIIALAETGSGKTAAFALPILQSLLDSPRRLFALVVTPTRELAFQIAEQFEALGTSIGLLVGVIVGGVDMATQAMSLAKRPHIVVATPGRLVDHLENTKGFNLRSLKYLVLDEADRILNMDFEVELEKIIRVIPKERHTFLFSATMTKKVSKLERASLKDPARIEVSSKYQTVETLQQSFMFIPFKYKEAYLVYVLNEKAGNTSIVFCSTVATVMKVSYMLRNLGFGAVPLHGKMSQPLRLGALNKFKNRERPILVCTDVASRGLDIPHVDVVINYDVPLQPKDYIHRVGRTARAGRAGVSLTVVTQYDVEVYQRVEQFLGKKLPVYEVNHDDVMILAERVSEAARRATQQVKDEDDKKKRKNADDDDAEEANGRPKKKKFMKRH